MAVDQTQAASSPANDDVFNGEQPTLAEYQQYRSSGEVPARFNKPAEEAPTDAPEETVEESAAEEAETEPESEPEEAQEPLPKGTPAQKRILQLLARVKELERNQPQPQPQAQQVPVKQPDPPSKPTIDATNPDGTPKYKTYEDFVEGLTEWKAEQQVAKFKQEQAEQQARNVLQAKLDDARSRYEDADEVIFPAAQKIQDAQIPHVIKQVIAESEFFPDMCYVLAQDPAELTSFISLAQKNPRAALAKAFEYERGIREELGKTSNGEKAPEPKTTSAPKPPSPVKGAGASRAFDVSDESLSADAWMRQRNKQVAMRSK